MGFSALRVINEDRVIQAEGFGTHPHKDMEIITYVLDGALEHKDSMGNGSAILPGDVQYMSAGSGVTHSEFNHSQKDPVHLLQIWIIPNELKAKPRYDQKKFTDEEKTGRLKLVASNDGADGSIAIRQDAKLYASILSEGQSVRFDASKDRHYWVQVARGQIELNGKTLKAGDGAALSEESALQIKGTGPKGEFLLFDLP